MDSMVKLTFNKAEVLDALIEYLQRRNVGCTIKSIKEMETNDNYQTKESKHIILTLSELPTTAPIKEPEVGERTIEIK